MPILATAIAVPVSERVMFQEHRRPAHLVVPTWGPWSQVPRVASALFLLVFGREESPHVASCRVQPCGVDVTSLSFLRMVYAQPRLCRTAGSGNMGLLASPTAANVGAIIVCDQEDVSAVLVESRSQFQSFLGGVPKKLHSRAPYR
jgi:hypothetical protein